MTCKCSDFIKQISPLSPCIPLQMIPEEHRAGGCRELHLKRKLAKIPLSPLWQSLSIQYSICVLQMLFPLVTPLHNIPVRLENNVRCPGTCRSNQCNPILQTYSMQVHWIHPIVFYPEMKISSFWPSMDAEIKINITKTGIVKCICKLNTVLK